MREFMQHGAEEAHELAVGRLIFKHIVFCVGHEPYILHCSEFVLRTEDLVILVKNVADTEEIPIVVHPRSRYFHELLMHHKLLQTLPTHDAHLGIALSLVRELMPGSSRQSVEIS